MGLMGVCRFFAGLIVAGAITVFIPNDFMTRHVGGGLKAMMVMLAEGIPLYIYATASTPVAAALIPHWIQFAGAFIFIALSFRPILGTARARFFAGKQACAPGCGCEGNVQPKIEPQS
jgi:hypothetical protein